MIHWNLGPKVACAPHSKIIAKQHMGLGFFFSQSFINLVFITVHPALYEDLISYVHVAHDLESLIRSTKILQLLKKLLWFNAKYEITEIISFYVMELNILGHVYSRFYVDLLK
jgi:hypothetical protein